MNRTSQDTATRRSLAFSPDTSDSKQAQRPAQSNSSSEPAANGHARTRKVVPGRTRRRSGGRRSSKRNSFWRRFYSRWIKDVVTSFSSLFLALLLWYTLGVISIGSSKILLTPDEDKLFGGVSPLYLTLQQLLIGSTLLRLLLKVRFLGSRGLLPWPSSSASLSSRSPLLKQPQRRQGRFKLPFADVPPYLVLSGVCFSIGFLATNYGFSSSSAAFVETVKAAEPITSATVAVWWGIEILSRQEIISLGAIVMGVLLSTLGNQHGDGTASLVSTADSFQTCIIVMVANLCFSFRGLYQKLFRATHEGTTQVMDDLNLQLRMQQIGVALLVLPVLFWNVPSILRHVWMIYGKHGLFQNGLFLRYIGLSLINGCAFASYNLASTYILSRISVVHHAALNCIRRIFAVVVTSIAFNVPITILGSFGIVVSFLGFMSFTHYKVQRQRTPKPVSSLLPVSAAAD